MEQSVGLADQRGCRSAACCPASCTALGPPRSTPQMKRLSSWWILAALLALGLASCALADSTQLEQGSVSGAQQLPSTGRHLLADDEIEEEDEDFGEVADVDPGDSVEDLKPAKAKTATPATTPAKQAPAATAKDAAPAKATPAAESAAAADSKPAATAVPTPKVAAPKVSKSNRTKKETFTNKVVEFAPAVNVTYGDDIDDEGASKQSGQGTACMQLQFV